MELQRNDRQGGAAALFRNLDWFTIIIYMIMVTAGVLSIYAASYDFDQASIFSNDEVSGKQLRWIGFSLATALVIVLVDVRFYENYAFIIYALMILLLTVTIFIAPDIKGSRSWLQLGPMSLQPAEFGKTATALALAKLFSSYNFRLNERKSNYTRALAIIFIPIVLILAQKETGSALAYMALFFVLYREGMSGLILLYALGAVTIFVVGIKYSTTLLMGIPTGDAVVFILLMCTTVLMLASYAREYTAARNLLLGYIGAALLATGLWIGGIVLNGWIFFGICLGAGVIYALLLSFKTKSKRLLTTAATAFGAVLFLFSVGTAFNTLMPHQQMRVKVTLGMEENLRGAGYNVNQSKIAIGSGGFAGKGFLNGTQTKLKFVPEQHTDFIFCTIGEERGFLGSVAVIILFATLIIRIITIAERQPTAFGRVYGYCVASFFIFHLAINVGMVIGLCPVIGIPLPYFSYGGSSLLGFTILLFILLRIDAGRREFRSY